MQNSECSVVPSNNIAGYLILISADPHNINYKHYGIILHVYMQRYNHCKKTMLPLCTAVVPSAPVIIQPPANTTVRLGERVNLTCISEGVPAPTYAWFRDNVELVDETLPYLLITSAAPNNRGYYICTVSNSEGSAGSNPILLSMRGQC